MKRKISLLFHLTGILQLSIGLGAIPAGVGFIIDPYGGNFRIPYELIFGTPFDSYLIPGICLLTVNGLGSLLGAVLSMTKHNFAGQLAIILGSALLIWMFCQFYWIGLLNWFQPVFVGLGLMEIALGFSIFISSQRQRRLVNINKTHIYK